MTRTLLALVLVLATGCGTLAQAGLPGGLLPFGGVRYDLAQLGRSLDLTELSPGEPSCGGLGPLLAPQQILDLPLSLALDVVLLPIAGIVELGWVLGPGSRPTRSVNPWARNLVLDPSLED